jgi:hypothetical protein
MHFNQVLQITSLHSTTVYLNPDPVADLKPASTTSNSNSATELDHAKPVARMWVPGNRAAPRVQQRTSSVHSIASVHSPSRNSGSFDLGNAPPARKPQQEQPAKVKQPFIEPELAQRPKPFVEPVHEIRLPETNTHSIPHIAPKDRWETPADDDMSSRSSTLDGEEDYMERIGKKPIQKLHPRQEMMRNDEPQSPAPAPHIPGPLESQLAALMSKLIYIEHQNPAVSVQPQEFQEMQKRLKQLEEEKKTWTKRHEAIWALRDEDVENNIKIRVSYHIPFHYRGVCLT